MLLPVVRIPFHQGCGSRTAEVWRKISGAFARRCREKFREDLNETHELFKEFVHQNRRRLDIDEVANGDVWYGSQAIKHNLIDEISTSDEFLNTCCETHNVWEVSFKVKKSPMEKFGKNVEMGIENSISKQFQHQIHKLWMK